MKRTLNAGCGSDFWGNVRVDIDAEAPAVTHVMDLTDLKFPDRHFDETRSISVLEHIPDWRKAVSEICRVTNRLLIIEIPVNSDIRKTDGLRILFPTPKNIRLLFSIPRRARETLWQFKPEMLVSEIERRGFKVDWSRVFQFYAGVPSRCYRFIGVRKK